MAAQYHGVVTKLLRLSGEEVSPAIFIKTLAVVCAIMHAPNQDRSVDALGVSCLGIIAAREIAVDFCAEKRGILADSA